MRTVRFDNLPKEDWTPEQRGGARRGEKNEPSFFESILPGVPLLQRSQRPSDRLSIGAIMRALKNETMVGVAQLVEHRVVIPEVAGSIPVTHPIFPSRITLQR